MATQTNNRNAQPAAQGFNPMMMDEDALLRFAQARKSIREEQAELVERIIGEAKEAAKAAAQAGNARDNAGTAGKALFRDIIALSANVTEAMADVPEFAVMMLDSLLAPLVQDEKLNTAKAYVSMGRSLITKVFQPKQKAGKSVQAEAAALSEKSFADVRKIIAPPADPVADKMLSDITGKLRFIARQSDKASAPKRDSDDDTLKTNAQRRLSAILELVNAEYNPVKAAADAATAKGQAAQNGNAIAANRGQNEGDVPSLIETSKPRAVAGARRRAH